MNEILEEQFIEYGKIISSALLHNNTIYYTYMSHGTIFALEEKGVLKHAIQGFITENGYFVDRILGLEIARYYNQIEYKHMPLNELFSEDLKKEYIPVKTYQKEYKYIHKLIK